MATYQIGDNAKIMWQAGTGATPGTYAALDCRDVTINLSHTEIDVSTRISEYKLTGNGLKDLSVDCELIWDPADSGFTAVKTAFLTRSIICVKVLDDAGTGEGPHFDAVVSKFDIAQPLDGALMVSVTFKPTKTAFAPLWITPV